MEIRHTIGTSTLNPIDLYPLLALTKQKTQNDLDVIEILQLRRKDEFTHLNPKTQIKKISLHRNQYWNHLSMRFQTSTFYDRI